MTFNAQERGCCKTYCIVNTKSNLHVRTRRKQLILANVTSGAASAPQPVQCVRKQELTYDLRLVVDRLIALSVREKKATIANDNDQMEWIARELEKLRERELTLLNEYRRHVQTHRCR